MALGRASRRLPLPSDEQEDERDGHGASGYEHRLEGARVDVYPGKVQERYRKDGEEPEGDDYGQQVVVPPDQLGKAQPVDLVPVAGQALCGRAGDLCWDDAGSAHPALAKVALFLCESRAADGAALLLILQCRLS